MKGGDLRFLILAVAIVASLGQVHDPVYQTRERHSPSVWQIKRQLHLPETRTVAKNHHKRYWQKPTAILLRLPQKTPRRVYVQPRSTGVDWNGIASCES